MKKLKILLWNKKNSRNFADVFRQRECWLIPRQRQ